MGVFDTKRPRVRKETVFHVGDLDSPREAPRYSYEARGLSVSEHPDVWRKIAHSVSGATYKLENEHGTFYSADPSSPREEVIDWAVENGFFKRCSAWKGVWTDAEGDERYVLSYDKETATVESQARLIEDAYVEQVDAVSLTERGEGYWADAFSSEPTIASPMQVRDLAPVLYAQRSGIDVDGVWWDEEYNPSKYSCPRGVILPSRQYRWSIEKQD